MPLEKKESNLNSVLLRDALCVLVGVDAEIADSRWQPQRVCAFREQCRLQERVQEGHPVARPVERAPLARVARAVDAAEGLTVLVSSGRTGSMTLPEWKIFF